MKNTMKDLKDLSINSLTNLIKAISNNKFTDENKVEFFDLFRYEILTFLADKVKELNDEGDLIKDMDTLVVSGRK